MGDTRSLHYITNSTNSSQFYLDNTSFNYGQTLVSNSGGLLISVPRSTSYNALQVDGYFDELGVYFGSPLLTLNGEGYLYLHRIRSTTPSSYILYYDPSTDEVKYGSAPSGSGDGDMLSSEWDSNSDGRIDLSKGVLLRMEQEQQHTSETMERGVLLPVGLPTTGGRKL